MLRILPLRFSQGSATRRVAAASLLVASIVVAVVAAPPSAAQNDSRRERDRVRAEKAEVAGEVNALRSDQADVGKALTDLEDNLRGQQAAYADAERSLAQAEGERKRLTAAEEAKKTEITALKTKIATLAVDAYVNPPSADFFTTFGSESASEAVRKRSLLDLRAGRDLDLLDELRAAEAQLEELREEAEQAERAARDRRGAVADRLSQVQEAKARQAAYVAEVERRLDAKLGEAASLAAVDSKLSEQIAAQEAALAASVRRAASSNSSASSGGGGSFSPPPSGNVAVTNVRGIYVASSVASQTEAMLAAAAAAGFTLSGGGYRDPSAQIALRRQNCGTSEYAIWQMPGSQCRPETARPGSSKHERGLAIDFRGMRYGDAAYNWLRANAGQYGYINDVPGEPWHWSVGGG